jgi:cytochrome c553
MVLFRHLFGGATYRLLNPYRFPFYTVRYSICVFAPHPSVREEEMSRRWFRFHLESLPVVLGGLGLILLAIFGVLSAAAAPGKPAKDKAPFDEIINDYSEDLLVDGRKIFRHDTFGSEGFYGGVLRLHDAIKGEVLGGQGPGVSPAAALAAGLKVDANALPEELVDAIQAGTVDLDDPATTVALLQLDAVVGVHGFFDDEAQLASLGITCALCHSNVDDRVAPGIGRRLDGWANQDLNVGAIISLAPGRDVIADRLHVDVPTLDAVLATWGPGKFDAEVLHDGRALRPDGGSAATIIPPAFGLAGVNLHTWTGFGSVPYWNAYVANTQMRGQGTFYDPRLNDPAQFPLAVETGDWNIRSDPDLVTSKLAALHYYQVSIPAPAPPPSTFEAAAAARGEQLFKEKAECATCHVPPLFLEPGYSMHTAEEIGIDDFQASRSPDGMYRTAPLKGLWTHMQRGFYHDGRFSTLLEVVNHYDDHFNLGLSDSEKVDLVEYLKSLGDVPLDDPDEFAND